jgi:hypothetical protein
MSQEVPPIPSSVRAGGGGRLFSKAISRSSSKRHKGHLPSASVPSVPFTFTVDRDTTNSKGDGDGGAAFSFPDTANDKEVAFSGIKLEIPQTLPSKSPSSANSAASTTMIVAPFGNNVRRETVSGKATTPIYQNAEYGQTINVVPPSSAPNSNSIATGSQAPAVIYQHIHDMASKRISTLDYLRKA